MANPYLSSSISSPLGISGTLLARGGNKTSRCLPQLVSSVCIVYDTVTSDAVLVCVQLNERVE